jgi:hypothetical protein
VHLWQQSSSPPPCRLLSCHLARGLSWGARACPNLPQRLPRVILGVPGCCRIALVSCSRELWKRKDVTGSPVLWYTHGQSVRSYIASHGICCPESWACRSWESVARRGESEAFKEHSLCLWLVRHKAAFCSLDLCGFANPGAVLKSFAGAPLVHLRLGNHPTRAAEAILAAVQHLTALTFLEASGGRGSKETWGLRHLPPGMTSLASLAELHLAYNDDLGQQGPGALEPLRCLTRLTLLDLRDCALGGLPPALSALRSLEVLQLGGNRLGSSTCNNLGHADQEGLQPLCHLTALSLLELDCCGLQSLPWQVTGLAQLASLNLMSNRELGSSGPSALQPLRHLTRLTSLHLWACGLLQVPEQLSALTALKALGLALNRRLRGFEVLACLGGLVSLNLGHCNLSGVPPQLTTLTLLTELSLRGNGCLDSNGNVGLEPLLCLPALQRLDLKYCAIYAHPRPCPSLWGCLQPLRSRGVDVIWEPHRER